MERPSFASTHNTTPSGSLEKRLSREEWHEQLEREIADIRLRASNILETPEARKSREHLQVESFSIQGRNVTFFGVRHTAETFARYEEVLRKGVRDADAVALEEGPEIQLGSRSMEERLSESNPSFQSKNYRSLRQAFTAHLSVDGSDFFHALENVAAREGKPVALIDQYNLRGATVAEESAYRRRWDDELPEKVIMTGGIAATAGVAALGASALLKKDPKMSRRGFLAGLGTAAAAVGAAGVGSQFAKLELDDPNAKLMRMTDTERKTRETIAYSLNDLRNVLLAERLEILAESLPEGANIAVFYGDGHRGPMKDYLQHPALREAKKQAYKLARSYIASNTAIGSWKFDFEEGRWKEQPEGEILKTKV